MARPFVTLKLATTLDGAIALANGQSKWITGPEARKQVHQLRADHDAVLTGIGTILADDPLLTVREVRTDHQPIRIVLDTHGRTPAGCALLNSASLAAPVVIITGPGVAPRLQEAWALDGVNVQQVNLDATGSLDLAAALDVLSQQYNVQRIMVEAGAGLAGAFVRANLVDQIEWFRAPVIFGGDGASVFAPFSLTRIDKAPRWKRLSTQAIGDDAWDTFQTMFIK